MINSAGINGLTCHVNFDWSLSTDGDSAMSESYQSARPSMFTNENAAPLYIIYCK